MKNRILIVSVLLTGFFLIGCASVNLKDQKFSRKRIGVLQIVISNYNLESPKLTKKFADKIRQMTSFQVISQNKMNAVLKSKKVKELRKLPIQKQIIAIGEMTNTQYLVTGIIKLSPPLKISKSTLKKKVGVKDLLMHTKLIFYWSIQKTVKLLEKQNAIV